MWHTELLDKARELESKTVDTRIPLNNLVIAPMYSNGDYMGLETPTTVLSDVAETQLLEKVGIPSRTFKKLEKVTQENVLKDLISKDTRTILKRDLSGTTRAILSSSYEIFDNTSLLEAIPSDIIENYTVSRESTNDDSYRLQLVHNISDTLKVGDEIKKSITFSNSETGVGSVEILLQTYICKCTNGLLAPEGRGIVRLPHFKGVRDIVSLYNRLSAEKDSLYSLMAQAYDNSELTPIDAELPKRIYNHFNLSGQVRKEVDSCFTGTPSNLRHVCDAFTQAAHTYYGFHTDTYRKLESIGNFVMYSPQLFRGGV